LRMRMAVFAAGAAIATPKVSGSLNFSLDKARRSHGISRALEIRPLVSLSSILSTMNTRHVSRRRLITFLLCANATALTLFGLTVNRLPDPAALRRRLDRISFRRRNGLFDPARIRTTTRTFTFTSNRPAADRCNALTARTSIRASMVATRTKRNRTSAAALFLILGTDPFCACKCLR